MFVATDKDGDEYIYVRRPIRDDSQWRANSKSYIRVPKGTIQRLLNYPLTWDDDCQEIVEYKDKDYKNNDYQGSEAELLLSKMIDFKDEEYTKLEKKVFNLKKQLEKYVVKIGNQKEEITILLSYKERLQQMLMMPCKSVDNNNLVKLLEEKDAIIKYLESKLEI